MAKISKILCPVDFSEPSRGALREAEEMAQSLDAELVVLHVVPPMVYPVAFAVPPVLPDNVEGQAVQAATEGLAQAVDELASRGVKASAVVEVGTPALKVSEVAEAQGVDMVVMSTRGHTGITHALLGSVAERVVRLCPCPVLTIKVD